MCVCRSGCVLLYRQDRGYPSPSPPVPVGTGTLVSNELSARSFIYSPSGSPLYSMVPATGKEYTVQGPCTMIVPGHLPGLGKLLRKLEESNTDLVDSCDGAVARAISSACRWAVPRHRRRRAGLASQGTHHQDSLSWLPCCSRCHRLRLGAPRSTAAVQHVRGVVAVRLRQLRTPVRASSVALLGVVPPE